MEDQRVKQLAETLKKQGLAASAYEATEKAKSILNIKSQNNQERRETAKEMPKPNSDSNIGFEPQARLNEENDPLEELNKFSNNDYDITQETASLNELMQEIGVTPEQVAEQEKQKIGKMMQEVNEIKEELSEAEQNPNKIAGAMEEIAHVNEEINEIVEERDENPEMHAEQNQDGDSEDISEAEEKR
ncbi:hypothetical protein HYU09_00860 [Candidatus Woesearchaeota archaeon]|nr:hypothetical protein [Candidatus Woesearchaeota archaeon]